MKKKKKNPKVNVSSRLGGERRESPEINDRIICGRQCGSVFRLKRRTLFEPFKISAVPEPNNSVSSVLHLERRYEFRMFFLLFDVIRFAFERNASTQV